MSMSIFNKFLNENGEPSTDLFVEIPYQQMAVFLYLSICKDWGLSESEAFGLTGLDDWDVYLKWQQKIVEPMMADTYYRLTTLIEVNKKARQLFANKKKALHWMQTKNVEFDFKTPKEYILMRDLKGMHNVNKFLHFKVYIEPEMTTIN